MFASLGLPRFLELSRAHCLVSVTCFVLLVVGLVMCQAVSAEVSAELMAAYEPGLYESPDDGKLCYRLLKPKRLQPGQEYPLVLFLHGAGERGSDNQLQLVHGAADFARDDRRTKNPAFVLFPQCPEEHRWVESPWDLKSGRGAFPRTPSVPMRLTLDLLQQLIEKYPIDTSRLYLTGLSMGGQGAWYAAAASPLRFAAMLEVCGGGDPTWAQRYAGIPIWAFHGQDDNVVPVGRAREMIEALAKAGHHPELRYVEYPQVAHDSWTRTYARDDVHQWLFSQRKK